MAELISVRLLMMRALYVALALGVIFFHLLPLNTHPARWAPPDLLVALTLAWVVRRPDHVPVLSVAGVMLLADLLFQRPPGLWALLTVLAAEYLRPGPASRGETGMIGEWLGFGLAVLVMMVVNRMILAMLAVPQAQMSLEMSRLVLTVAVYPLVVLFLQGLLRVRRPAPGDGALPGGRA